MKIKQNTTKNKVYYTVLTISYYILLYLTIPLCFSLSNALLPAWCWSWGRVAPTTAAPCANMQSCTTRIFDSQTRSRESNPASPSLNRRNPGTIREQSGNSLHSKRATVARRCKRKHFKHFQTFSNIFKPWCFNLFKVVSTCGFHRCPAVQVAEQQKELADDAAQKLQNLQEELNGKDEELQTVSWLSLVMQWCFEPFEGFSNFSAIFRLGLRVDAFCHSLYDFLSVSTMIWCINRADLVHDF